MRRKKSRLFQDVNTFATFTDSRKGMTKNR